LTVTNQPGAGFADASLELAAGDVQRIREEPPVEHGAAYRPPREDPSPQGGFEQRPFFENHLHTLAGPVSLAQNSVRQIELFAPVSGGRMRISKPDAADGCLEFIVEAVLGHAPAHEPVADACAGARRRGHGGQAVARWTMDHDAPA